MKLWSKRLIPAVAGITFVSLLGAGLAGGQTAPPDKPQLAEEAFKVGLIGSPGFFLHGSPHGGD